MSSNANILIAEDESIVARHIGSVLERSGYQVGATVSTGEAAVAKARQLRPDLVLMDVALRGRMDGIEAAERIRAQTGIPVIYLTAYADDTTLDRAKLTEPAGFVLKPFDDRELKATVEMAVYRIQAARRRASLVPDPDGAEALYRELSAQRDRLRRAYSAALGAREQEARRIGRELHDEAGQLLASLHLALDDMGDTLGPRGRARIPQLRSLVDEVEHQLRRISHEMRPAILDDLGLGPALQFLAEGFSRRHGVGVEVKASRKRLPADVETNLYRIAQEALSNVARHAHAGTASVVLAVRPRLATLEVSDDGRGFVPEDVLGRMGEHGLGFIGLQERVEALGGRLQVVSRPGAGTRLRVTVPLPLPGDVLPCASS